MPQANWQQRRAECQRNIQRRWAKLVGNSKDKDITEMADRYMENLASTYYEY